MIASPLCTLALMGVNITWVGSPWYPLSKTADSSFMMPSLFIEERGNAMPVR